MKKVTLGLLGITLISLFSCSSKDTNKETIPFVKTATVLPHENKQEISLPGKVKASLDINLSFKVSGTIAKMTVNAGDYVKRGQLLAEIDPKDYQIQFSATEAEYKQVKGEAERIITLYEKGSVTTNDYEKAVYGLQQITAKYDAHKKALEDTRLYAPFDGYIQKRLFKPNETVAAGYPVVSLINTGSPEVEVNISALDFLKRDAFTDFSCTVEVLGQQIFPLELIAINQKANMNQLYTMRLGFKGNISSVHPTPGMTTMVSIFYNDGEEGKVAIPLSAIFEKDSKSFVWVYNPDNSQIKVQEVELLEVLLNGTVILSGALNAGDIVITAGIHSLNEGDKVTPLPIASSTNIGGLL